MHFQNGIGYLSRMKTTLLFLSLFLSATLFGQNVYIPDANFKAYLLSNQSINTNGDNEIQVSEATAFDGGIHCSYQNISDLTGIEAFTAITVLNCQINQLTSLNVSNNTALTELTCYENQLTSLDVSNNNALEGLGCEQNNLTSLDVSNNTALEVLACFENQLTSLDVSDNTALEYLYCHFNQITSLDVSNNTALEAVFCHFNQLQCLNANNGSTLNFLFCDNNQLSCVSVSAPNYAYNNNNYVFDPWVTFQFQCVQNPIDNDINQIGNQLTAEQNGATFQWLDCDNNYAIINGETNQSYTATTTGNYAVQITQQFCFGGIQVDTSTCVNVDCQSDIDNDVNQIGTLLTAVQNGVSYQWLDCDNNYSAINGATNQTYTPTTTGYFAVELTSTDACGGIQVDTSTCNLVDFTGIGELNNTPKQLIKIVDAIGRETAFKPNTPLIYVYDDGSIEKVFSVEY